MAVDHIRYDILAQEALRGTDLMVADQPREFAAQVAWLLEDTKLRVRMGQSARAAMEQSYSWETRLADLESTIASVRARHHPEAVVESSSFGQHIE